MSPVQIFVEGVADQKFLQDVIFEWYGVEMSLGNMYKTGDILELEGKDAFDSPNKLKNLIPIFQTLAIADKPVLVIFDADEFSSNYTNLFAHSKTQGFEFFLFPNHASDGDLETLLESLIHPANQVIFDCWQSYEDCLKGKTTTMTSPAALQRQPEKLKFTLISKHC